MTVTAIGALLALFLFFKSIIFFVSWLSVPLLFYGVPALFKGLKMRKNDANYWELRARRNHYMLFELLGDDFAAKWEFVHSEWFKVPAPFWSNKDAEPPVIAERLVIRPCKSKSLDSAGQATDG